MYPVIVRTNYLWLGFCLPLFFSLYWESGRSMIKLHTSGEWKQWFYLWNDCAPEVWI